MKLNRSVAVLAALAGLGVSLPAAAQFARPDDAVKYRKAGMTMLAAHFGRLGAMANGRAPYDAAAAAANADLVVMMSKLPYAGFVEGTSSTVKGGANANVWTERAKFDAAAKKMQDEVVKLQAAAKSGSVDQLKSAFGPAANACNACPDDFRNP
jgi:cytochrome c556